jgi:hypothetical protein
MSTPPRIDTLDLFDEVNGHLLDLLTQLLEGAGRECVAFFRTLDRKGKKYGDIPWRLGLPDFRSPKVGQ